ncbi:MAG: hypothetical protein NXH80_07930 [Rhodobacteraceae bacterium]|nr:hypothetical protein [Paracoccaceae bacterium]
MAILSGTNPLSFGNSLSHDPSRLTSTLLDADDDTLAIFKQIEQGIFVLTRPFGLLQLVSVYIKSEYFLKLAYMAMIDMFLYTIYQINQNAAGESGVRS